MLVVHFFFLDTLYTGEYIWEGTTSNADSYTNWGYGEPNDMFIRDRLMTCPGEDCIQIKTFSGNVTWQDLGCDTKLPYICERVRGKFLLLEHSKCSKLTIFIFHLVFSD